MRTHISLARAAALFLLCAAAGAAQTALPIDPADLKADVSFLASDGLQGRGTPSPGLDAAAEYIASRFRRAGLVPAGDDGYFQTAQFVSLAPNTEGVELSFDIGGKKIAVPRDQMALLPAAAAHLENVPALRVASREALAALTPEQVRGKVLLLEGAGSRLMPGGEPAMMVNVLAGPGMRARAASPALRPALDPRIPGILVWDPAVREALAHAKDAAVVVTAHVPEPAATPVKLRNVIGVLPGSGPALKDTYVFVTAHYDHLGVRGAGEGDHIFNGANDDASGTATVIEAAAALAARSARPRRTIVFMAVFGEELGLTGSRYYAAHPLFPLAKTVADINVEQVGRTDVDGGSHVGQLNVTGFDFSSLTSTLREAGDESGIKVVKDGAHSDAYFASSDNQAFADAGVPAHTVSVGYMFPDYHGAGDEWPKLDYDNMAKVARTVAQAVLLVADDEAAPQWNAANPKTERYVRAREAAMGADGRR